MVHAFDGHESRLGDGACHAPGAGRHVVGRHGRGLYRFPAHPEITEVATAHPLAVYTTRDGLTAPQVFRLFEDSRGHIWISTIHPSANGLGRWDPRSGTIRDLTHAGGLPEFRDDRPRSFGEEPSGTLWFGFNNGLARYAHDTFTFFTPDEGLPPGAIMDIHAIGPAGCGSPRPVADLFASTTPEPTRPRFVSYATRKGLSSDNAVALAEDSADGFTSAAVMASIGSILRPGG